MCKNIVQPSRSQMTIWSMHVVCWITKGTSTHSKYITHIAFPLQKWLHERTSVLRYADIVCLVLLPVTHQCSMLIYQLSITDIK